MKNVSVARKYQKYWHKFLNLIIIHFKGNVTKTGYIY